MTITPTKTESGCLICGKSDKKLRKGLCPSHYNAYLVQRNLAEAHGLTPEEYDGFLIEKGLLTGDARQVKNVFADALKELKANLDLEKLEKAAKDARDIKKRKE